MTMQEWSATQLSLMVAVCAVTASLIPAVGIAWLLAKRTFPGKILVETLVNLPLVLPPVVTGYLLLVLFGRRGYLGPWLEGWFGIRFVFDWKGAALASAVVGFPLLVRPIRQAFEAIDTRLLLAAKSLGANPWDAFCSVALPLALPGILSGAILAFARSIGEFGATIMIAGNIPGETRTIPLFVYTQLETPGGFENAIRLVVISIVLAAVALLLGDLLERSGRKKVSGASA